MTPLPIYTFLVNNIDYQTIYSQPLPNSIENVIGNLKSQAVYIPFINRPLAHGDVFTLYGKRAQTVYDMFVGKTPKVLELISKTSSLPTIITKNLGFEPTSLPIKTPLYKDHECCLINYSGKSALLNLEAFSADNSLKEIRIKKGSELQTGSSFSLEIEDRSTLNFFLSSDEKFYFSYTNLVFED